MMSSLSLIDIAHTHGGVLCGLDRECALTSVAIDSRKVSQGDCFVAIRGERFDAHEFLDDAIKAGASSLVVEQPQSVELLQWVVEDSVKALGKIALENRKRSEAPLIAITGSNGKTSVKEMLASILGQSGNVLATRGNFNNEVGVPLTLFRLSPEHNYAVIEMGASVSGDIKYLCDIAEPTVSLVNNVGEAHLEKFGSVQNIFETKGEIYAGLRKGGTAVVNLDSYGAPEYIRRLSDSDYIGFSTESADADIYSSSVQYDNQGSSFNLSIDGAESLVRLSIPARHNVANALAAAACAYAVGISAEQIVSGLESFAGVGGRLQVLSGINGSTLIDDSYNASPTSAQAAIDVLASYSGRRVLVLGDMAELGASTDQLHADLGVCAREAGIDSLVASRSGGFLTKHTIDAFGQNGHLFASVEELVGHLREVADSETTFLVKGSRASAMDKVVDQLRVEEG